MKNNLAIAFIILACAFFYALTLRGAPGNPQPKDFKGSLDRPTKPLELSPERGRFATVLALGEYGTTELGQTLADAVYPDVGYMEGKFYSFFAPGLAYLVLPAYLFGRLFNLSQVFTFAAISVFAILSSLFLYRVARDILKLSIRASVFAVFVFAFATTSWSYAITLYQHFATTLLMLSAFYAAWKYRQGMLCETPARLGWLWAAWIWLAYGFSITIDYPNAVLLLPIMVYFLYSSVILKREDGRNFGFSLRPAFLLTVPLFLVVAFWQGYYNQNNFGDWKKLNGQLADYPNIKQEQLVAGTDAERVAEQLSGRKGLESFFHESNIPRSFYVLTVSSERGLFFFSPILLLAFLGIYRLRRQMKQETKVLLALAAVNVLLYSSWGDPWGGWAYGPRYLIPTMAILPLFVSVAVFGSKGKIWPKLAVVPLLVYSSAVALLGALVTNSVPSKMEAVTLPLRYYNYLFNIYLLRRGENGSFIYNTYLSGKMGLVEYYFIIFGVLMIIMLMILFWPRMKPLYPKQKISENHNLRYKFVIW